MRYLKFDNFLFIFHTQRITSLQFTIQGKNHIIIFKTKSNPK